MRSISMPLECPPQLSSTTIFHSLITQTWSIMLEKRIGSSSQKKGKMGLSGALCLKKPLPNILATTLGWIADKKTLPSMCFKALLLAKWSEQTTCLQIMKNFGMRLPSTNLSKTWLSPIHQMRMAQFREAKEALSIITLTSSQAPLKQRSMEPKKNCFNLQIRGVLLNTIREGSVIKN